ncbi:hypothetical protein HF289_07975 [Acidithiobacillus ferrooxidans]|uniref:hypothetical protein n=1 Tax=Acidithiobacillus ferrooxidans TaxID=920 RepID=UPI001C06658E|nr:hypothetical protein [Acidithiobacillus ferrooxidans]MBU2856817.1 hypothetical protein [Acidithiobacillus ferrooxidans]
MKTPPLLQDAAGVSTNFVETGSDTTTLAGRTNPFLFQSPLTTRIRPLQGATHRDQVPACRTDHEQNFHRTD